MHKQTVRPYVSVIYLPDCTRDPVADRILHYIAAHTSDFTFIAGQLSLESNEIALMESDDLEKCLPQFEHDREAYMYLTNLLSGRYMPCDICGSYKMNATQAYRSNAGIISKTSECALCVHADNVLAAETGEIQRNQGTHAAAKHIFSALMPKNKKEEE